MSSSLLRTSQLSAADAVWMSSFLSDKPWFDFYYQCAIDDLREQALDNRSYLIGQGRKGLIMAIHFDRVSIFSVVGHLEDEELAALLDRPEPAELHLEEAHVTPVLSLAGARVRRQDRLRYYRLEGLPGGGADPRCRRIGPDDRKELRAFFAEHYPETILSSWMLELPMVGVWEGGHLMAAAGTIVLNTRLRACHIGNFLTAPSHRGRGLAKVAALGLFTLLREEGVDTCSLGVFDQNEPAWRAYETLGFKLVGIRDLVYLNERD